MRLSNLTNEVTSNVSYSEIDFKSEANSSTLFILRPLKT